MSTFDTEVFVPEDGAVVLPEKFRGKNVFLLTEDEEKLLRILQSDYNFRHPKSLEEIVAEQDIKPIESIEELIPEEPIWESDEEFFEFLEAIGESVENYRSIEYLSKESPT